MNNFTIAKATVNLLNTLPNINRNFRKYDFDISAFNWNAIKSSPIFPPMLLEQVEDNNQGFAAIFPTKRKYNINNFMTGSSTIAASSNSAPYIVWTPLNNTELGGAFKDKIDDASSPYYTYDSTKSINYVGNTQVPSDWSGPVWMDTQGNKVPFSDDIMIIDKFLDQYNFPAATADVLTTERYVTGTLASLQLSNGDGIPSTQNIWQQTTKEGLWWAIRSSPFLKDNMPFWVTVKKNLNAPSSDKASTYLVIRIGGNPASTDQQYDIWIGQNIKPFIIDYLLGPTPDPASTAANATSATTTAQATAGIYMEFESDMSRIMDTTDELEIGVMTMAGRLVVFINNNSYVYTRVEKTTTSDGGTLGECVIKAGSIDIYGTNMQATINVSPMVFAPFGIMNVPMPAEVTDANGAAITTAAWNWKGIGYTGLPDTTNSRSVCMLPTPPSIATDIYGCDCQSYIDAGGTKNPVGRTTTDFHNQGVIRFKRAGPTIFPSMAGTDIYYISMIPTNTEMSLPTTGAAAAANVYYGGCPYFFRVKGGYIPPVTSSVLPSKDISDYVISVSENSSAGDYFHTKGTATVVLYNPGGAVSNLDTNMMKYQKGIDISWGWSNGTSNTTTKTFTGIITNVNSNEIAGKELLTLSCVDYMHLLSSIPIINSPFYDGMVASYAIKELASRAGIIDSSFIVDWGNEDDYFLPSGFSYSQPAMKFPSTQKLFECMIDIVKRFEAFIHFDGEGKLHISKLAGGLFSIPPLTTATAFVSDITGGSVILGERNIDFNFESTVNCISIFTLDRNSKNAIIYGKTATSAEDRLLFRKPLLLDQSALGELDAAKSWASDLADRVFKPIIKTRFSSVGTDNATISALGFVTLDGQNFRVTSIKREFNAENNDYKTSFECEWLGG